MQSTGHTSTQELSFCPMQGSAITYAMWRANLANALFYITFRHGHHLADAPRSRQAASRETRHRPAARAARPVPDGALPGADRGPESGVRPWELGPDGFRRGRVGAEAVVGGIAGASAQGGP